MRSALVSLVALAALASASNGYRQDHSRAVPTNVPTYHVASSSISDVHSDKEVKQTRRLSRFHGAIPTPLIPYDDGNLSTASSLMHMSSQHAQPTLPASIPTDRPYQLPVPTSSAPFTYTPSLSVPPETAENQPTYPPTSTASTTEVGSAHETTSFEECATTSSSQTGDAYTRH
ncbi:hypothetical protein GQ54DRAFT_303009 [Martensiomyces pterosporus]|nr:hypothetical protein GQ54DRAFT_303009 [Martensiomyces pterosporus]